jgi:predicted nucleotidyltransferase
MASTDRENMGRKAKTTIPNDSVHSLQENLRKLKPTLNKKFKVKRLGLFGSFVRGQSRKSSDIDILVEFSKRIDLLDFVALERYLSERTGFKIDLVSLKAIRPEFKDAILNEVLYI